MEYLKTCKKQANKQVTKETKDSYDLKTHFIILTCTIKLHVPEDNLENKQWRNFGLKI